jgi:hypothetical protein
MQQAQADLFYGSNHLVARLKWTSSYNTKLQVALLQHLKDSTLLTCCMPCVCAACFSRLELLQVVRREGVAALWKGNLATILHRLPYSSINFYTYEHTNRFLLQRLPPNTDFGRTLAAGGLAGLVACSAVSSSSSGYSSNTTSSSNSSSSSSNSRGALYHTCCMRWHVVQRAQYSNCSRLSLTRCFTFLSVWLVADICRICAAYVQAYPLDLVRTRLAVQTQGHYYHGILPTLQRIVADEGAVGLYRGLGATLLQVAASWLCAVACNPVMYSLWLMKGQWGCTRSVVIVSAVGCDPVSHS